MKTFMLGIVSIGVLTLQGGISAGAPAPADLTEVASLKMARPSRVADLVFSPDGKTLFSLDGHKVWLWDVASRKHVATLEHVEEIKPTGAIVGMALSPDGKMLATYRAKTIMLWDVASRKDIATLEEEGDVYSVVFSPDSKTLSAAVTPPRIPVRPPLRDEPAARLQIWDVEKKKRVRSCKMRLVPKPVRADLSVKKPVLAIFGRLGDKPGLRQPDEPVSFTLVDAFTGEAVLTCEGNKREDGMPQYFALNRTETMLASSAPHPPHPLHPFVQLRDRKSGKCIAAFKYPDGLIFSPVFSPDGKILAAAYVGGSFGDCGILLFAVPSGKILTHRKQRSGVSSWAFTPDGRLLAMAGSWGEIKLWSIPERWRKDK
jgi:WD40 repeat protein